MAHDHCQDHSQPQVLPMVLGPAAPQPYDEIPPEKREQRAVLGAEQCEIDGERFFVRGRLQIPVHDSQEPFQWLVWVALRASDYIRTCDLWETVGRESERPFYAVLANDLEPFYPSALNLKARLHTQLIGERPLIVLEPSAHPLAIEQHDGITLERVRQIAAKMRA